MQNSGDVLVSLLKGAPCIVPLSAHRKPTSRHSVRKEALPVLLCCRFEAPDEEHQSESLERTRRRAKGPKVGIKD